MRSTIINPATNQPFAASYKSGSRTSRELASWQPMPTSADESILPEKAAVEGRAQDLVRNNPITSGAVQSQRDNIVGSYYKLSLKPDWRMLGVDTKVGKEWERTVERMFELWANDPECWIDAQRKRTLPQFMRAAVTGDFMNGECFVAREWIKNPTGFSTCFKLIEAERICTPFAKQETDRLRAGIETNAHGEATHYHVRHTHPSERGIAQPKWQRIAKRNKYGWLQIFHVFEALQASQRRGISPMASTIQKLKMLDRFEDAELEAAILATVYSLVIKSEFGSEAAFQAMGGVSSKLEEQAAAMLEKSKIYGSRLDLDGVKPVHLFENEDLQLLSPNHPNKSFESFEMSMLRHIARGMNMSYEQLTGDYTKTTYSSARASINEAWKYVTGKRANLTSPLATLMFRAWLDEAIVKKIIPLPSGVTNYWKARSALTKCIWIGAGKGQIDELKSAKANSEKLDSGEISRQQLHAENGNDYEVMLDQQLDEELYEKEQREKRGLPAKPVRQTQDQFVFGET